MSDRYRTAPDLPSQATWFHTDDPLSFSGQLSGHVVVVHFFSVSSVHCLHQLQVLTALESRFRGRPFVVVGVHVAREVAEQKADYVKSALDRLALHSPVVLDPELELWQAYSCSALPTITVVDTAGKIRFQGAGEAGRDRLDAAIQSLLDAAEDDLQYVHQPFTPITLPPRAVSGLRNPAGLAVDEERDLLWIADTGNDRLVACDLETGAVRHVVGSGQPGASGGNFDVARFSRPRGIAIRDSGVLVVDTGNHLIRQFELDCGEVSTLTGQGRPVVDLYGGACFDEQGFASPWDLVLHDDQLFVAMAGLHQIWLVDLYNGSAEAFAGQGTEDMVDGTRYDAAYAQPEALAVRGEVLGCVDRVTGRLRCLDLQSDLVSSGDMVFTAPRSIVAVPDGWLVGDARGVHRVSEGGEQQGMLQDGVIAEALEVHAGRVFIADAENHRILRVDLESGVAEEFALSFEEQQSTPLWSEGTATLRADAAVSLRMELDCPMDLQIPLDTPAWATVRQVEGHVLQDDLDVTVEVLAATAVIHGLPTCSSGEGVLEIVLEFALCLDQDAVWHGQTQRLRLAATLAADGPDMVDVVVLSGG